MTGVLDHFYGIPLHPFHIFFSCRPVDSSCLTESAPPDTATLDLQGYTVLRRLNKRHDRLHRIWNRVKVHYHLLPNLSFCMRIIRFKALDRSICMIGHIIELRHIDSFDLCRHFQKPIAAASVFLILSVCI